MHCRYRKQQKRKTGSVIGSKSNGAKRLLKFAPLPSEKQKNLHKQQCYTSTTPASPPQLYKIVEANKRSQTGLQVEQR